MMRRKRVPYFAQFSEVDCGAACLRMLLAYYGSAVSEAELEALIPPDRDGVSALQIARAARTLGCEAVGLRVDRVEDLKRLTRPAILHWKMRHFVVLERFEGDWALVVDPGLGRRRVDKSELSRCFTGILIDIAPPTRACRRKEESDWKWLVPYIVRHARFVVLASWASLAIQLGTLALAPLTATLVDRVFPAQDGDLLVVVTLSAVLAVLVRFGFTLARASNLVRVRYMLLGDVTRDLLERLLRLPYAYFQQHANGDLMARMSSGTTIREFLLSAASTLILDIGFLLIAVAVLIYLSPLLTGVVVALVGARLAVFVAFRKRQRELHDVGIRAATDLAGLEMSLLGSMLAVKAAGGEDGLLELWRERFARSLDVGARQGLLDSWSDALMSATTLASPFLILAAGCGLHLSGQDFSMGALLAFNAVALNVMRPVTSIVQTASQMQLGRLEIRRARDVLRREPEDFGREVPAQSACVVGTILVENVTFTYGGESAIVSGVSMRVQQGEFIGLVGPTGSGKSTLAALIAALYMPSSGRILLDEWDTKHVAPSWVRSQVALVPERTLLIHGTLLDNLVLGAKGVTRREIDRAVTLACLEEDLSRMPLGLHTWLSDDGSSLSAGQRQRVGLARALLRRRCVFVLDEATSSLDTRTEQEVLRRIRTTTATLIVITHRVLSLREASRVFVLEGGQLIQAGDPTVLLSTAGLFRELALGR